MTTFNKNNLYRAHKNLISRKNQDNTVILMKMDDSNTFYKLTGMAATLWQVLQTPTKPGDLESVLAEHSSNHPNNMTSELQSFWATLFDNNLLETTTDLSPENKLVEIQQALTMSSPTVFGGIKTFDLAQIENEVLNESIYLDVFAGSDMSLKSNIKPLKNSLNHLMQLEGVKFDWNDLALSEGAPQTPQIGLIAQQVYEQMPDLVRKDAKTGHLTVNYLKMIPYLIEGFKELKSVVDQQNIKISQLEDDLRLSKK